VPRGGPVTTLCGQTLVAESYAGVDTAADCANCIRRSRDPSRISSAFFEQEEGSELLRLSLEQARFRKPAPRPTAESGQPAKPINRPTVRPAPAPPEQIGDLRTSGFKAVGNGVWRSPGGVVIRMTGKGRERFAELVFEGTMVATRVEEGIRLRAGDVEITATNGDVQVRLKR
jgi:hypothetical protein